MIRREIIKKALKVPVPTIDTHNSGDGEKIARQLDIALMKAGFKLSGELLGYLSKIHPAIVKEIADEVLSAALELVVDHVNHNVYFKEFPLNVPDTEEFWCQCIVDALFNPESASKVALQLSCGVVNLLDLPKYGKCLHSYEEMLAVHQQFIPSIKDRITILHLGKSLPEEALALYLSLAGSAIPLNESDRKLLAELVEVCLSDPQPEVIPVRENKAIINQIRLNFGRILLIDTPTDVLRLACALSGGDETLVEKTKFKSFPRKTRRALMVALDEVVKNSPAKLADINQYAEEWKRLGERLHPHEFKKFISAQQIFAVARGEQEAKSLAAKIEMAFAEKNISEAIRLLAIAPGTLFRNIDRVFCAASAEEAEILLKSAQTVIGKVSGRVVLSVREHLQNRVSNKGKTEKPAEKPLRVFANSKGKAWIASDARKPLAKETVEKLLTVFDAEILRRLPAFENLVVDPEVLNIALPLSDKNKASGFGIMPRGSLLPIKGEILRFFVFWMQKKDRTDYDLSGLMLDEKFQSIGQISWTRLTDGVTGSGNVHSGDITSAPAPNGASEFIDFMFATIPGNCRYIVPQVNKFAGEDFQEVAECFFGFMERTPEQKGKPFEPRTVRMKSEIRGKGNVALPLIFLKDKNGQWQAKWLHLYLNGKINFNRVEANRLSTALLVSAIARKKFLTFEYLVDLLKHKASTVAEYKNGMEFKEPIAFIGIEAPDGLPVNSKVYTLSNLQELIPA